MIINPKYICEKNILTNTSEECIQQNGIDLRIMTIEKLHLNWDNECTLERRSHTGRAPFLPWNTKPLLLPGIYDITFMEAIEIPNGMCAQIITRSTINRGGNFITAGLYDAGYKWVLGCMLHVHVPLRLEYWVRLAQIIFHEAQEWGLYEGIYNEQKTC